MLHSTSHQHPVYCLRCLGTGRTPALDRFCNDLVCESCDGLGHSVHVQPFIYVANNLRQANRQRFAVTSTRSF